MELKNTPKKLWLKGGIIGLATCVLLFLFYLVILFPAIEKQKIPASVTVAPLVTGHFYPILSGFVVPYGMFCEKTETSCTTWNKDYTPGSIPWVFEGNDGYCENVVKVPTVKCAERSENLGFIILFFVLLVVYFLLGAGIGKIIEIRQRKLK